MIEITTDWPDYELIDSGRGQKFERFGKYTFIRPESQAIWTPKNQNWQADGIFTGDEEKGHWRFNRQVPPKWEMHYKDIGFWAQATPFRHMGVFPEQAKLWDWMENLTTPGSKILNLFGYTGIASLILAKKGAQVTHLDASKKTIGWARENQALSHLEDKPIRWIVDDAVKFVERESRRESKYDAILLDPPKYGRGPEGEIWKIEESLPKLLRACKNILTEKPLFVSLTTYALRLSATSLGNLMSEVFESKVESGELALKEKSSPQLLTTSIFSRLGFVS